MIRTAFAIFGCAVLLAGCQTTTPAERLAENGSTCAGYGFKAGTDAYATCMMGLDQRQEDEDRRRQQAIGEAVRNSFSSGAGNTVRVQSNCTYNRFGNTVQQTCM